MVYDSSSSASTKTCLLCKRPQLQCICLSSNVQETIVTDLDKNNSSDLCTYKFDLGRLVSNLLIHEWQRHCVISKTKLTGRGFGTIPLKLVVSYTSNDGVVKYLRHNKGPLPWYFWDTYGDDFLSPEVALIAISKSPPPPNVERDHL